MLVTSTNIKQLVHLEEATVVWNLELVLWTEADSGSHFKERLPSNHILLLRSSNCDCTRNGRKELLFVVDHLNGAVVGSRVSFYSVDLFVQLTQNCEELRLLFMRGVTFQ